MHAYNFVAENSNLTNIFPHDVLRGRHSNLGTTFVWPSPAPWNLAG